MVCATTMDMNAMLDLEKRTGVKDVDINEFIEKASAVEAAVRGIKEGTIDLDCVPKIPGIKTPEEIGEEERARQLKIAELKEKNAALQSKRQSEERERWWAGAEFFRTHKVNDAIQIDNQNEIGVGNDGQKTMDRYTSDYSRWNTWEPSDPTSIEERSLYYFLYLISFLSLNFISLILLHSFLFPFPPLLSPQFFTFKR